MNPAGARTHPLRFAARPRVVVHHLGRMFVATAALGSVPGLVCYVSGAPQAGGRFLIAVAALALFGALGARLARPDRLQRNEALVVSALAFVVPPLVFAWPLTAFGLSRDDALFEAVSAITTTGLTVVGHLDTRPAALLFARAWLQWIGGLGVVVLVLALLTHRDAATRHLGFSRLEAGDVAGGTRAHARRATAIYAALTLAGFLALWLVERAPFPALLHALAAVSTGGFSDHDTGLAALGGGARAIIAGLSLAGAVAFYSYYTPAYSSWRAVLADAQLKGLLAACLLVSLGLYLVLPDGIAGPGRVGDALTLGFSAQTDAGFAVLAPATLGAPAQALLIGSMLTGGALGSTAGGIKILRLLILARLVRLVFARLMMPAPAYAELRAGRRRIDRDELESVLAVVACYAAALAVSWLIFLLHGKAPMAALFEVSSALATGGLSAGLTASALDTTLKGVLCVDMLLGRVEILALVILVLPQTWIGRRRT